MKKSNRKNTIKLIMLALVLITLCLFFISGTYARYASSASGTGSAVVAKWAVKINTVDIVANDSFTVTFSEVANDNVVNDKIAPGSRLYADFVIDPTGSEVAVDYNFVLGAITASAGSVPTGVAVEKVCYVNSGVDGNTIALSDGKYTGTTIPLESQTAAMTSASQKTVRVYILWTDGGSATDVSNTVNVNHTTAGDATPTLSMTITGSAFQHI